MRSCFEAESPSMAAPIPALLLPSAWNVLFAHSSGTLRGRQQYHRALLIFTIALSISERVPGADLQAMPEARWGRRRRDLPGKPGFNTSLPLIAFAAPIKNPLTSRPPDGN